MKTSRAFEPHHELEAFFKNPGRFAVLVLGERGIGKSRTINEVGKQVHGEAPTYFNSATVEGDSLALSALFGHEKGAYTGAYERKSGLFHDANRTGMLFFDEVHNLNRRVQEKLMSALQTVEHKGEPGWYRFRRLGSDKEEYARFQPVFASNKRILELEELLLPDFFDRINQLSLSLPSLREQRADVLEVFTCVWRHMRFSKSIPEDPEFTAWLNSLPLHGNYRDLEKIAILVHQAMLNGDKDPGLYARSRFEQFDRRNIASSAPGVFNFRRGVKLTALEYEYREALYKWALSAEGYGSKKKAQDGLGYRALGQLLKVKKD